MTQRQNIRLGLVLGLFFISLGGFMLHFRIHNPSARAVNYIPFAIGLFNIIVVPWLFLVSRWSLNAYLLNGLTVIFGIILMAHLSIAHAPDPLTLKTIFFNTTLADIIILMTKFMLGKALFDFNIANFAQDAPMHYKPMRYPNLGWWLLHLAAISLVYVIGAIV